MNALERLDHVTSKLDDFVPLAARCGHAKDKVIDQVARSRNLTRDHAAGVVDRRWPKPAAAAAPDLLETMQQELARELDVTVEELTA